MVAGGRGQCSPVDPRGGRRGHADQRRGRSRGLSRPVTVAVMPSFRLVASDIDGTLIHTDGTLSARSIDVLAALPVPAVLVTGRPVRWLRQLYDQMPAPLPAVCANGAAIYDPVTDRILRTDPLGIELLLDVTKRLREAVPDIAFAVEIEDGRKFVYEEAWPVRWEGDENLVRALTTPEE